MHEKDPAQNSETENCDRDIQNQSDCTDRTAEQVIEDERDAVDPDHGEISFRGKIICSQRD